MADRGRGRSRGRGRGQDERGLHGAGHSSARQPQGGRGNRPGPRQEQYRPPAEPSHSRGADRATQRLGPAGDFSSGQPGRQYERQEGRAGGGESGTVSSLGRAAMRGRRIIIPDIFTRPTNLETKKGTSGNVIRLQSNYFQLLTTTDWCLYQYHVDFAPEEDRTIARKGLLRVHKELLGAYVFDGTVLYSSKHMPDTLELWSKRTSDDANIQITVRFVGVMDKGDHHYIQFFNIIMRKCLELLKLQLVGREYFDARSKIEIRDYRLELWPGYLTSIRQHENNILMCSEITHKVMRQQTLLDILNDCYTQDSRNYKNMFESQVLGSVVLTDYNNNTYRITDIDYDTSPNSTFQLRSGEAISYKNYYKNKYEITIRNDSQPMLVARSNPRERRAGQAELIYLVPELCRSTGLTDSMKGNYQLMDALSVYTRVSPKARIDKLMMFNRRLREEKAIVSELNQWNLKLNDRLVEVSARVLPPEKIVFDRNSVVSATQFANWSKELHSKPVFNAARLNNWVVVCVNRSRRDVERFVAMLQESANGMNCRIDSPRYWNIADDRSNTYTETLEQIMSMSNPELVFCVVSNNRADRYSAIKKKCIIDRPVPSQVFIAKNLSSKNARSIATKVAIQINCKLGGAPWTMEVPPINLMVVGFDVCHDPNDRSRDYGAMVATLDKNLTRYYSTVNSHTTGEELSNEFSVNLVKALHTYKEVNKILPSHILIYRDGVGEGQVPYVYEHEVEQVKTKLNGIYGESTGYKMAFVIVTKRINTRFFLNQNNPPPGTIVDDVVTNPMRYDFYVISQNVRNGTVSPSAYNVIADTTGWRADQMQRITYKLTHMYYNWCGTVRVPAPCQYAHKLAFLVSQYVRRPPSTQMETLLYYL